ncbi:hypothetical protein [Teichococcus aestuarii]|uniref:Uncharacterized protein n=1 Tax=Teichococcus aestuarii TaxID=568898 RepID=A0A2U1UZ86_9PROT|nr:hypothetical protein [Pseudoroseomonas aestuarii]PWC26968.1 hypothetical protein CR165_20585 [Pseudoroseomonas aestuarii]
MTTTRASASHRDAALVSVCAEYHATWNALQAWDARGQRYPSGSVECIADEEEGFSLIDRLVEAVERAGDMQAMSSDGLRQKAAVLRHTLTDDMEGCEIDRDNRRVKLAVSLCNDLQRVLGDMP